ncbi:POT family-domain-containing protein [Pilobolus umbonatus]|nr:POT family-domain-containing protein [Pilobolus umbonatus]
MGQSTATALQNFFTFFCYLTPLLGAVIADQYLGKFRTILLFSVIYLIGLIILTCTSLPSSIENGAGFPGYLTALLVIGLGTGGIKGIVAPLCADQLREKNYYTKQLKSREKVVVDYQLSIQHLYNWFYWAVNVGALLGGIICPLLELNVGFWAAFLLPTCVFTASICIFVSGSSRYHKPRPSRSILLKVWKVIRYALHQPKSPNTSFLSLARNPHTDEDDDKTLLEEWDNVFIDELEQAWMACKIFIPLSIYWVCYNQLSNNLLSQAAVMYRPEGVPNDIMNNFDPIALILFIPILDRFIYPWLQKHNISFLPQQRITAGFFLGALSMIYAAVLQYFIYHDSLFITSIGVTSNVSVFLQIPCYVLIALSECLASITSMEYAYTHAPESMKSLVSALSLSPNCIAALISLAISPVAHDPNMAWVYTAIGLTALAFGFIYYFMFKHYDVIDREYNRKKQTQGEEKLGLL